MIALLSAVNAGVKSSQSPRSIFHVAEELCACRNYALNFFVFERVKHNLAFTPASYNPCRAQIAQLVRAGGLIESKEQT
jgi:hypothetical protein